MKGRNWIKNKEKLKINLEIFLEKTKVSQNSQNENTEKKPTYMRNYFSNWRVHSVNKLGNKNK